jgi:hypothetical protein
VPDQSLFLYYFVHVCVCICLCLCLCIMNSSGERLQPCLTPVLISFYSEISDCFLLLLNCVYKFIY